METIAQAGGHSAEPGSALIGTQPNNTDGGTAERLACAYVSEISHQFKEKSYLFGGGLYPRGHAGGALVGKSAESAVYLSAEERDPNSIDYYLGLNGEAPVGDCVVMAFRTQIFTSRSHVLLLEGVQEGRPSVLGRYDAQGRKL
jgi:predicted amino acid racemase